MEKPLVARKTAGLSGGSSDARSASPDLAELPETPGLNLSGKKIQTATRARFSAALAAVPGRGKSSGGRRR